ncbi:MAG TPA: hypothetical protein VH393_10990 [Ktedonobacterales bacterium]
MLIERLRKAIDRAAEMPEVDQDAVAAALERLIGAITTGEETSEEVGHPPALRPELAAIVEQSLREHAETLEYLKDR